MTTPHSQQKKTVMDANLSISLIMDKIESHDFISPIEIEEIVQRKPNFKPTRIVKKQTRCQQIMKSTKTILSLTLFGIILVSMLIVITPNYYCFTESWERFIISLIFMTVTTSMIYYDTFLGSMDNMHHHIVDWWTLVHLLAGCVFAITLPFAFATVLNLIWILLESYTNETSPKHLIYNRILDAIAVTIGWFATVFAYYFTDRLDIIPWVWGVGCDNWPFGSVNVNLSI
eukprot:292642_1